MQFGMLWALLILLIQQQILISMFRFPVGSWRFFDCCNDESNLNIRQEPSTEAAVVGKAAKGEVVTLVEQSSDDWWKIKTEDGEEGYAYARYLKA
jgi:uncharacterized protein YgiM (DUF1202 family)